MAIALWRGWLPARAWLGVVALQALLVGGGGLALASGEQDEERVEKAVGEAAIESHVHAAQRFVAAGALTLAVAATALAFARKPGWQRSAQVATVALSLGVLGLGVSVGHKGGALVYRDGAGAAWAQPGNPSGEVASPERADDD
jgi:hypothetical protein